jgi:hypothetical protein
MNIQSQELCELYQRCWSQLVEALRPLNPVEAGLSNPLLIDLPHDWENVRTKLMIIGQQTNGWGSFGEGYGNDPIAGLIRDYAAFSARKILQADSILAGGICGAHEPGFHDQAV